MNRLPSAIALVVCTLAAPAAWAQGASPSESSPPLPPPAPAAAPAPSSVQSSSSTSSTSVAAPREGDLPSPAGEERSAPPAGKGFQIAARTGYALPMGKADSSTDLSNIAGGQVPFLLDVGGKVHPNVFVGGYLGLGVGGAGGTLKDQCDLHQTSCAAVSLRIGVEAIVSILPDSMVNPWVGYGIGYEGTGISANGNTVSLGGPEFARLMAGVDFRVSKIVGIGPFAEYSIGQYSKVQYDNLVTSGTRELANKELHEWLTIGAKVTFFP